jgi:hypothetical protein
MPQSTIHGTITTVVSLSQAELLDFNSHSFYLLAEQPPRSRLSLTDPDITLNDLLSEKGERVPGTCEWITHEPKYQNWLRSESSSLWLISGPGKGKTMIAMYILEILRNNIPTVELREGFLLFFFCNNRHEHQNNAIAVFRGLLYQLIKRKPHLEQYCAADLNKENYTQTIRSFGTLWRIFVKMLNDDEIGDVYCILDGVEECDEASRPTLLRHFFEEVSVRVSTSQRHLRLLGISRDILGSYFKPKERIEMGFVNSILTRLEIAKFIDHRLKELANIDNFHRIHDKVRATLLDRSDGTFLVVALLMQQLDQIQTAFEMEEILETMPTGLESLYNQMLSRLDTKTQDVLEQMLRWMLVAQRPLTALYQTRKLLPRESCC